MKRLIPMLVATAASVSIAQNHALYLDGRYALGPSQVGNRHTIVRQTGQGAGSYLLAGVAFNGTRPLAVVTRHAEDITLLGDTTINPTGTSQLIDPKVAGAWDQVLVGATTKASPTSNRNVFLQLRDSNVNVIRWTRVLDVASGSEDNLTVFPDRVVNFLLANRLWVAGTSTKNGITRWFLAQYDLNGNFQFLRTGENHSRPTAMCVDETNGDVVMTYNLDVPTGPISVTQNRIIRFSRSGTQLWRTGYNPYVAANQNATFNDVAFVGSYVVAVGSTDVAGTTRPLYAIFNPTTGVRLGQQVRTTIPGAFFQVHQTTDHLFFATGRQTQSGTGILTTLNDPTAGGVNLWTRKASPSANDVVSFVETQKDAYDNLYFLGWTYVPNSGVGIGTYLGRYTRSGLISWSTIYRPTNTADYEPLSFRVNSNTGQVFLGGRYLDGTVEYASYAVYNQPCGAVNKSVSTERDTVLLGFAGLNDRYPVNGTFNLVSGPDQGTLDLQTNGTYSYTPPAGWTGITSFTYNVSRSGVSTSGNATVEILVF